MSIHLNCQAPTPTFKRAVQLAAWKNCSGALQLVQPYVSEKQTGVISHIFEQCAKDPSNAPEMLKQLVSVINLSEVELLPNEVLQRIFAQTLVYHLHSPLEVVSRTFYENISDHHVISLMLDVPKWQSKFSLKWQEIKDFQKDIRERYGVSYSSAEMLKRLPNIELDLTNAHIDEQLLNLIIKAGPYLKRLNLSKSTLSDHQLAQIVRAAPQLLKLNLSNCQNLKSPNLTGGTALTKLSFLGCRQMKNPPKLAGLTALTKLNFFDCNQMRNPPDLTGLSTLTELDFSGCRQMQNPPILTGLGSLTELSFSGCRQMRNPPVLTGLGSLTELSFSGCRQMRNPPVLTGLGSLTELYFISCNQMQKPPKLTGLTALAELSFSGCSQMKNPPELTDLTALIYLNFVDCNQLQNPPVLTGLTALRTLSIRGCNNVPDTTGLSDELDILS